ncbi:uncharacterized protein LOC119074783 isoform X2 [Bradysia coprophila]|uniref:uncharacterized protein LOC119074783 isoform X2 n=1 Tax=Bradysia coprophila TaxID=38358 RepID=UPI00187DC442|nr:uncharacterized protein LOC119074783 isoform X2 [Bradysia coprophila]
MPSSQFQWRALVLLGALLLVVSLWPLTCAALPIDLMTYQSNLWNSSEIGLANQRPPYSSAMSDYGSSETDKYSSQVHDDIINVPMTDTVFLRRKRKRANPSNRSTSYTIRNYFNAARPRTIIQRKELSSSTPQTLQLNDLYLAGTPSSLSITTYEPVVGLRKLSSNNSLQMRLSQATIQNEIIASVSVTTQPTTSIKLNQNQKDDDVQLKLNRNNGANIVAPTMFLNQTISPTLQTVFSYSPSGSKRLQMTSTESIFSRTERSIPVQARAQGKKSTTGRRDSNLDRNERSTNFSHIAGTSRKIQLLIKNRLLQLLPDGTVNGTQDDGSDYTILQRATVDVGKIRIQGVATCLFLCMDACGNVYGTEFTDDCVFNELMLENYNIYASTYHSNSQKTFYLALNKLGQIRKTHLPANKELGKLATYAKSFTFTVPDKRTEDLITRLFGANHVKHGLKQLCDSGKSLVELVSKKMKHRPKCGGKKGKGKLPHGVVEKQPKANDATKCTEESCQRKKKNHSKASTDQSTTKTKKNRKNPNGKRMGAKNKTKSIKNYHQPAISSQRTTTFRPYQATTVNDDYSVSASTEQNDDDDVDETTLQSVGTTMDDGDEDPDVN